MSFQTNYGQKQAAKKETPVQLTDSQVAADHDVPH